MPRFVLALIGILAALQAPPPQAPPPQTPPPPPPPPPCLDPTLGLRCPDLVMGAPRDLRVDRKRDGRVFLRMRNAIVNRGSGPAELFAQRTGPREMTARQVITDVAGGRRRVRVGPKLRYCLRDRDRVGTPGPGSRVPARRVFPACNQSARKTEVTLGTSVGWADVYPASYPGNVIDVTGLRGCFVVLHRADPEHHILEASEANNVSARVVRLPFRPGAQRCPRYVTS
jgi:hypothetical protein